MGYNSGMGPTIRLLPFATADGATNMSRDEAMLESASGRDIASLRFYGWSEPTVSLGYFQPSADRLSPNLAPLTWVRRSTGGAGIVHHRELTYAFALPSRPEWKFEESWICRFHYLLSDLLASRGVESRVVLCGEERKLGEALCFLHQTPGDLLIQGSKVAGSAQRKLRGAAPAARQHTAARERARAELRGINDFAGKDLLAPAALAELLAREFATTTGATVESGGWTTEELGRMREIRTEKYANAEWNGKR